MPPSKKAAAAAAAAAANNTSDGTAAAAPSSNSHARKGRNNGAASHGSTLKELALATTEAGAIPASGGAAAGAGQSSAAAGTAAQAAGAAGPGNGMAWQTASLDLLNTYRVAYHLQTPAAFASPLSQALLTNPGIGRQSPSMARRKEKRRVPREQLAFAVRKHFNSAAVNEMDVVVDFMYKVKNQDKAFRMRMHPGVQKKSTS